MLLFDPGKQEGYYRMVVVVCDLCKKQRSISYHTFKLHSRSDHRCKPCASSGWKREKFSDKYCKAIQTGKMKSSFYKGCRITGGYKQIHSPDHPRVTNKRNRFVAEHILVIEKAIGRYLERHERVHHINENKLDNRIENLYLCSGKNKKESNQIHNFCHQSAEDLTIELFKLGKVGFKDGKYYFKD